MSDGSAARGGVRISDPRVMRALAHPARIEILDHLHNTGAGVTATEAAEIAGLSPSATSYHLRELARYGLVEQAPGRGDGRERVWRSAGTGVRISAEAGVAGDPDAERAVTEAYLAREYQRAQDWARRAGQAAPEWRDASMILSMQALLTPEELIEVNRQVQVVLDPYRRRERQGVAPDDARTVRVHYSVFPDE